MNMSVGSHEAFEARYKNITADLYLRAYWAVWQAGTAWAVEQHQAKAPLCDEHLSGPGSRSGCPYCAIKSMASALSRIDYAMGEPNEMRVSDYDVHYSEDAVVEEAEQLPEPPL